MADKKIGLRKKRTTALGKPTFSVQEWLANKPKRKRRRGR